MMTGERVGIWKEVTMAYFNVISGYLLGNLGETSLTLNS